MDEVLYTELISWYRLIDPPADHDDEAREFLSAFHRVVQGPLSTLLELGSGAGHNASHLKAHVRCTLSDLSERMLELSRELNPECEHISGDMRTLRLDRTFDAVLIHDAIAYMTTEEELAAAIETAFVHTRPGGAAIFAPDIVRDEFREFSELLSEDGGGRSMRCLAYTWDPDPNDSTYSVDYAFLLRDGAEVRAVHDRHVEGLFFRETWLRLIERAGFRVELIPRSLGDGQYDRVFLCLRP